ncbi:MAG: hypothetical protein F6K28_46985 [Microcoleus sp. SIO2G3]|nr:hypothetical protein [Microcoleus sp. SIO2G3]
MLQFASRQAIAFSLILMAIHLRSSGQKACSTQVVSGRAASWTPSKLLLEIKISSGEAIKPYAPILAALCRTFHPAAI